MLSSDYLRNLFLVLYTILMPLDAWPSDELVPTKSIEIRLERDIPVSSEKIILGDVATIYAKSMHDFQILSSLVIAQVPKDSKELKMPLPYLRARIKEALPAEVNFTLKAPIEIVFRQEKFGISKDELAQEIIRQGKELGKIPAGIEVQAEPVSGFEKLDFYKLSSLKIEPAGEMPNWKGELNFKVSIPANNNGSLSWVKIKIRWFADAWVASSDIRAFQNLQPEQFKKTRTEITNLREELVTAADEDAFRKLVKSGRARRAIYAQAPLVNSMLERKPDMAPGQKLKVVFVSENGLQVSADGAIIGTGIIGDDVKAKLRSSKKIVTGKLVSDGVLEVSL